MKKKLRNNIIILSTVILVIVGIETELSYHKKNNLSIGILYSDAAERDSELIFLNDDLNTKKNIKIDAINAPMVSHSDNNLYIPTGFDNKLFILDKNLKVNKKNVQDGATYIKTKNDDQLILFNIPINEYNGDKNRVYFSSQNQEKYIDISKSLLLCGDFDREFIYVIGEKFIENTRTETHLFIINRNTLELVSEQKLPDNIVPIAAEIMDDKLLIGSDSSVDYFLYYDTSNKVFKKIKFNESIKKALDVSDITYTKDDIFLTSYTGDIIKLDRESFEIKDMLTLKNRLIVGADIKDDKLYLLSQKEHQGQIALINVINTKNLTEEKESSLKTLRNTMPTDIFIYQINE
ncbi:hypothetical protein FDA52_16505 [Clostridium botulinum]|uniref:hypothetical protein n=1 Tax=Clostridium botulinum TaxID=1491 RepID=UPI000772F749|nr:hypothetical protein [Clostridium botulinum]NFE96227.1 hypothetical protein [Clostridium botulinum]NFI54518.1 hypothetical protein [Clostridium botulinum]NFL39780.1 hypothetical protein [Clostridium botulinum]NFL66648.1 hypothetical protein [Clostridium botulinum]NFN09625.1 hypothetical protein [Clostridium botulinum]